MEASDFHYVSQRLVEELPNISACLAMRYELKSKRRTGEAARCYIKVLMNLDDRIRNDEEGLSLHCLRHVVRHPGQRQSGYLLEAVPRLGDVRRRERAQLLRHPA